LGGPGLIESIYEEALAWELAQCGLDVQRQRPVPVTYKGHFLGTPLRLDLHLNRIVLVDAKATVDYHPIFEAQMLTYLRLMNMKLGLVINFGERYVANGIHRVVNGL